MRPTVAIVLLLFLVNRLPAQQAPVGWRWVTDQAATLVDTEAKAAKTTTNLWFVEMAPGYHVTMGPGGTLFPTAISASGRFELESEVFLFPGESGEEYGVFIGGNGQEGASAAWTAFVARRDGSAAVIRRRGGVSEMVRAWRPSSAIVTGRSEGTARNVLRVTVDSTVTFQVNGAAVARLPRDSVAVDGHVGFRVGKEMNVHVTSLDLMRRLAPVPSSRRP